MSRHISPEEQQHILLERMEEKRRLYRENFSQQFPAPRNSTALLAHPEGFPRSHTFRLIMQHPYLIGLGLTAVVILLSSGKTRGYARGAIGRMPGLLAGKLRSLLVPAALRFFRSYLKR